MATRRIPISSQGARAPPAAANRQNNPPWQSSLDIVFSFARSQTAFGSNLPTSPSFVQRYRRPNFPDDEESITTAPSDREAERTTSDDGTRGGDPSDEDWSEDEIDARAISWDSDGVPGLSVLPGREQLPRNAVINSSRKSSRARSAARSAEASTSAQGPGAVPASLSPPYRDANGEPSSERSPLLSRKASADAYPSLASLSPPDSAPFRRRTPLVSAALLSHTNQQMGAAGNNSRRLSIISAEGWKEALEEERGQSTFGQTLFNAVNVLVGVGLLAEPLAFADAGWALGTVLLLFCALVTNYTAKMLARLMSRDASLRTYTDVLIKAFGLRSRPIIHAVFVFELGSLSIALVILFSDTMASLFPKLSSTAFKIIGYFLILPTTFIPLRFLSITSIIGILSSFMLLFVLAADGCIKRYPPGSLWVPEPTSVGPRWIRLPLSFGLFMSGFAGHAVIPALYRDMKEPHRFESMINLAYGIAFAMSLAMGALGYIMFGNNVSDEVSRDLRHTHGYPQLLNKIAIWMIAINPAVKYALASGPLASTLEFLLGFHPPVTVMNDSGDTRIIDGSAISSRILDGSAIASEEEDSSNDSVAPSAAEESASAWLVIRPFVMRPLLLGIIISLAICIPNFGIVLSLLGSSSAFAICAIGPIGAYLILGRLAPDRPAKRRSPGPPATEDGAVQQLWNGTGQGERILCYALLGTSIVLAVTGSVWVFLPIHHNKNR